MWLLTLVMSTLALVILQSTSAISRSTNDEARDFVKDLGQIVCKRQNEDMTFEWNYDSNITEETEKALNDHYLTPNGYPKAPFKWADVTDPEILRCALSYGYGVQTKEEADRAQPLYDELAVLSNKMTDIFNTLTICDYNDRSVCNVSVDSDVPSILASSSEPDELLYYWVKAHDQLGLNVRPLYEQYISIGNQAAVTKHYKNRAEEWVRYDYEMPSVEFEKQMDDLWTQLRPLYEQLHAYVRRQLYLYYGDCTVNRTGPIPAHILGNPWASHWESIYDKVIPYPDKPSIEVTEEMLRQKYTVPKMVQLVEEFYKSINLSAMTEKFKKLSIFQKPEDRDISCAATSFDFYTVDDFRILCCAEVTMADLLMLYHESGHIQYFMAYKDQPCCYRAGANPAFHEAVGDTIALSASSIKHMQQLGLMAAGIENDKELQINSLLRTALDKVALLPYALALEKWRWSMWRGDTTANEFNAAWWKLRYDIGGIAPPVPRGEQYLDAASKYHVVYDHTYIEYYVGGLLEFEFHGALCEAAGQYNPAKPDDQMLSNCDIYGSTDAGNRLKSMLQLGSSKRWPEVLEMISGQSNMDAQALLDYFRPLYLWLLEENKRTGENIGW